MPTAELAARYLLVLSCVINTRRLPHNIDRHRGQHGTISQQTAARSQGGSKDLPGCQGNSASLSGSSDLPFFPETLLVLSAQHG